MFIGTAQETFDRAFLKKLDNYTQREVYIKVIALDWNENAISEITGNVVSGNLNIDGSSTSRRTCSLNLLIDSAHEYLNELTWSLRTKFALLVGLKNYIDPTYGDIVWFQQGIFIITSFSQTLNAQGLTVAIQGKDKMCLLDGSVGGSVYADHDFGSLDVVDDDGNLSKEYIAVHDIVRSAVHTYALEPYENIIISDLDSCATKLLEYRIQNIDLFIYDISTRADFSYYTSQMVFSNQPLAARFKTATDLNGNPIVQEEVDSNTNEVNYFYITDRVFRLDSLYYRIVKHVAYGDTAGQTQTDLTYAGELIIKAGEPVTKALTAVVQQLGEFEYFYDIYGRFVLQRKRIYHNIAWTGAVTNEGDSTYYDSINSTQLQYEFLNGILINTFSNKPNLLNIKNDYVVWGATSNNVPIHLRYAIDRRPTEYTSLFSGIRYFTAESELYRNAGPRIYFNPSKNNNKNYDDIEIDEETFITAVHTYFPELQNINQDYRFEYIYSTGGAQEHIWQIELPNTQTVYSNEFGFNPPSKYQGEHLVVTVRRGNESDKLQSTDQLADWRELIYQMAYDYSKSESRIEQFTLASQRSDAATFKAYKTGVTPQLTNCWYYNTNKKAWEIPKDEETLETYVANKRLLFGHTDVAGVNLNNFSTVTYLDEVERWQTCWNTGYDAYYSDFLAFWRLIYDNRSKADIEIDTTLPKSTIESRVENYDLWVNNSHWDPDIILCEQKIADNEDLIPSTIIFKRPESLLFWFDFIGENSELSKYDVNTIGRRPKVVNDNDVKAIFFRETPEVLFIDPTESPSAENNLKYVKLNFVGGLKNYFTVSARKKNAKETLDNLVYEHTYCQESIQISSLPIYYLEPNTRISVADEKTGICGEYFIKSFSYALSHDGLMSITASRAMDRIL